MKEEKKPSKIEALGMSLVVTFLMIVVLTLFCTFVIIPYIHFPWQFPTIFWAIVATLTGVVYKTGWWKKL